MELQTEFKKKNPECRERRYLPGLAIAKNYCPHTFRKISKLVKTLRKKRNTKFICKDYIKNILSIN